MRLSRILNAIHGDAEGESRKVVIRVVVPLPGKTMFDQMLHFSEHQDHLAELQFCEPRDAVCHSGSKCNAHVGTTTKLIPHHTVIPLPFPAALEHLAKSTSPRLIRPLLRRLHGGHTLGIGVLT